MQHTRRGPTQLRFLAPGSLVLFGSCRKKARFVVDTVFVVGEFVDHSAQDWEQKLDGRISSTYRKVTVEPWYRGAVPDTRSHRLYFGATPPDPAGDLFSFVPCQPYDRNGNGFARPEVRIPGFTTGHLTQGKKMARDLSLTEIGELWKQVVRQMEDQGVSLGTYAMLPSQRKEQNVMQPRYPPK